MPDLNGHSILQVAALRRMTSDPELAARCEAWLRDRGALQARHFLTRWFVGLAAGFLLFMWMEFDELVDAEMPTMRLLGRSGAIVIALIGGVLRLHPVPAFPDAFVVVERRDGPDQADRV